MICLMLTLVAQLFEMQILNKWPTGAQHERGDLAPKMFLMHFGET